ncbi:Os03g0595050, partial [Oryza sativa Japonica Group]
MLSRSRPKIFPEIYKQFVGTLHAAVLLQPEQDAEEVVLAVAVVLACSALADDVVHDGAHSPVALLGLPERAAEPARQRRRRVQVGQVEPAGEPDGDLELAEELVAPRAPAPDGGAHDGVVHHAGHHVADGDHSAAAAAYGALFGDGADEARRLVLADVAQRLHAARAEELEHADPPELAPQVAVGGEEDVPAAAGEDGERGRHVAAGEARVVRLEHLPGRLRRRHDERRHGAEPEQHERAVPPGELAQRPVGQVAVARQQDVVQAPDERQPPRPRRQPQPPLCRRRPAATVVLDEEEEEERGEDDGGAEQWQGHLHLRL